MDIQDLRVLEHGREIRADVCIVGSGPAGLTIASELIGTGIQTLIVESGSLSEDAETDALNEIESVGAPRVMDQKLVRNRLFGGTSHSWTGRCAPFDDIDFAVRPWVPFSGWPMPGEALEPFLRRACSYVGLGPHAYDERLWDLIGRPRHALDVDDRLLKHCFWQFSNDVADPLEYMRFGPAFLAKPAPNVRILLNATVTHIQTNDAGSQVAGLEVTALGGNRATIRAETVVLCAGGIENARIMLYSNRQAAAGIGNRHGVVGRYLMDHPRCILGEFDKDAAAAIRERYGLFRVGDPRTGHFFAQGVGLSPQFQEQAGLLNCAAWLTEDRALDDPWDAAKRLLSGRGRRVVRDGWLVLSQPHWIIRGVNDLLFRGRGLPHKLQRLMLDCIVEQRPDPESRVLLGEKTDALGLPVARLDWRISQQERDTVIALGAVVCSEFKRIGLPVPTLTGWVKDKQGAGARFVDVSHPIGTTRMSDDPRSGVVDADCRVHGVGGLYVAGSSVFPTSSHANPTLMVVALAVRLADHLKEQELKMRQASEPVGDTTVATE